MQETDILLKESISKSAPTHPMLVLLAFCISRHFEQLVIWEVMSQTPKPTIGNIGARLAKAIASAPTNCTGFGAFIT